MTPEPRREILDEVYRMLACAKPAQIKRLLEDIARIPAPKDVHYDA